MTRRGRVEMGISWNLSTGNGSGVLLERRGRILREERSARGEATSETV